MRGRVHEIAGCADRYANAGVIKDGRKTYPQGRIGSIRQRYGDVSYAAFEVWFGKQQVELFWHHELEEAEEFDRVLG